MKNIQAIFTIAMAAAIVCVAALVLGVSLTLFVASTAAVITAAIFAALGAGLAAALSVRPRQVVIASSETSLTDPLTRTMNQHGIDIALMEAMALGERYGGQLSVIKLDIDAFDNIVTQYGKTGADQVLSGAAAVIADALRMPDKVGRYGKDEFVVVMPQTAKSDAERIAERLYNLVSSQEFDLDGAVARIVINIGVTEYRQGEDITGLMQRVQAGVDQSRRSGDKRVTAV